MHHRIVLVLGSGTCAEVSRVSRRMTEPKPAIMRRGRQLSRVTCHEPHKRDTGPGAGQIVVVPRSLPLLILLRNILVWVRNSELSLL